jgi:hypothetical protein
MHLPKRFWLVAGFTVSVISVVVNTLIIANFNDDKVELQRQHSYAKDRLLEVSASLYQAEAKFDTYKVLHHLAYVNMPKERASDARDDAMYMLEAYLSKAYGAASNVPAIDLYETETQEMGDEIDSLMKLRKLMNRALAEKDPAKIDEIYKEIDTVETDFTGKTELGKKLRAVRETSEIEKTTDTWLDWELAFLPTTKALREKTIATIKGQKAEVANLEKQIADIDGRSDLANYVGIALQMLGLMLVLGESVKSSGEEKEASA